MVFNKEERMKSALAIALVLLSVSLLPAQNTGGNFTKVVQRVPVKIGIKSYQGHRLLPGMNAIVRIYIK